MIQTLVSNGVSPNVYDGFDRMPLGGHWRDGRAGRVIAIDEIPERLRLVETHSKAEMINFEKEGATTA